MARGTGKILDDAPNRGAKRVIAFLNDAPECNDPSTLEDAGNGFLTRQGYAIVWCGWQGDLMPLKNWLVTSVAIATSDGKEIIRNVRTDVIVTEKGIRSQPLSGWKSIASYETASRDKSLATLTVRKQSYEKRMPVPESEWEFALLEKDPKSGREKLRRSTKDLYLGAGVKPATFTDSSIRQEPASSWLGLRRRARSGLVSSV